MSSLLSIYYWPPFNTVTHFLILISHFFIKIIEIILISRKLTHKWKNVLTLETVGVEEVFTLFVTFDSALGAADALTGYAPKESFTLVAVCRRRRRPRLKVVWRRRRDGVDQTLQCFLIDVHFLSFQKHEWVII